MCLIVLVVVVVVVVSMVVPIEVFPHVGSSNDDDDVEAPDAQSVGCCGAGAPRHPPPWVPVAGAVILRTAGTSRTSDGTSAALLSSSTCLTCLTCLIDLWSPYVLQASSKSSITIRRKAVGDRKGKEMVKKRRKKK